MFVGVRLPEFRELQGCPVELFVGSTAVLPARATAALAHPHTGREPALNAGISYAGREPSGAVALDRAKSSDRSAVFIPSLDPGV
jgi:hypothetical protein